MVLLRKTKQFSSPSFPNLGIIIRRNPGRPTLSLLVYQRPAISFPLEAREKIKVTIKAFNKSIKTVRSLPLASTLLMSKNRTRDSKTNKALARSDVITIRKWVTMSISIPIVSQKTSFGLNNLFINDFG